MPKKVHFSDHVTVKEMSVDRETHVQEVKNPKNMLEVVPSVNSKTKIRRISHKAEPQPQDRDFDWLWVLLIASGLLALAIYLGINSNTKKSFR